jgi:membrane-associated protease RseP (regulator of RpoE activity)
MSVSVRRAAGLAAAILTLIGVVSYRSWRLGIVSRRGLAGFSHVPPIGSSGRPTQTGVVGLQPGSVIVLFPGSPAERAGLQRGDVILSINGVPSSDLRKMSGVIAAVHRGSLVRYHISRNGQLHDIVIKFDALMASPMFAATFSASVAVALTFLLIGAFVFWRRPLDSRAIVFYAMTLVAAVTFANTSLLQVEGSNVRGIVSAEQSFSDVWHVVVLGAASLFFAPLLLAGPALQDRALFRKDEREMQSCGTFVNRRHMAGPPRANEPHDPHENEEDRPTSLDRFVAFEHARLSSSQLQGLCRCNCRCPHPELRRCARRRQSHH